LRWLFLALFISSLFGETIDCNKIFQDRKDELLRELEKIDEQTQALEALKAATNAILDKKKKLIDKKEAEVNATMQQISQKEANIKSNITQTDNKALAIKKAKDDKISETYSKMKESAAATIMQNMDDAQAAKVIFNLKPKKISKIMANMDPKKASSIKLLLLKGPPFDSNDTN